MFQSLKGISHVETDGRTGFSLLIGSFQAASTLLPGLLMSMAGVWVEAGYSESEGGRGAGGKAGYKVIFPDFVDASPKKAHEFL